MFILNGKRYLSIRETSEMLVVKPVTVYRMLKQKRIIGFMRGGTSGWCVEAASVQDYLDRLTGVTRPKDREEKEDQP